MKRYGHNVVFPILVIICIFLLSSETLSQVKTEKPLLSNIYSYTLKDVLIPQDEWHPFPTIDEREAWTSLPLETRKAHIQRGISALDKELPMIPATAYLDWYRGEVKESDWHKLHGPRRSILTDLVIAECVENEGRFMDAIINTIWAICEETAWYQPAHIEGISTDRSGEGAVLPLKDSPTIALRSSRTASILTWTIYLLGSRLDEVSPVIRERVQQELEHRILKPLFERNFRWMYFDFNWNPQCSYQCLPVILLMEMNETRRIELIHKMLRILDNYIIPQPSDGSCTEGPSYWRIAGGALFNCLELLHASTNGSINLYDEPLIQNIGRFILHMHINDNYYVNISDGSSRLNIPGDMVYRYGQRINDDQLSAFGAYVAAKQYVENPFIQSLDFHELRALFSMSQWLSTNTPAPLIRDVWYSDEELQMMTARSENGTSDGLFVAAWGGHNRQHHNHNDVGNFIIFIDGVPMLIDTGPQEYTSQTFGPDRYRKWTLSSAYHNLPTINKIMQGGGREFKATNVNYESNITYAQLTMDIAQAYPTEAQLSSWIRTVRLNRNKNIEITDSYSLKNDITEITLSLMTPCTLTEIEKGVLELENKGIKAFLKYNPGKVTLDIETIDLEDEWLKPVWGDRIYRILLRSKNPPLNDKWNIIITH